MSRKRRRLARDAFHHVPITTHGVNVEIKNVESRPVVIRPQPFAGNGHAHAVSAALPQRTGGRFNASGYVRLRMPGRLAVKLAETLNLFHRQGGLVEPFSVLRNLTKTSEMHHTV